MTIVYQKGDLFENIQPGDCIIHVVNDRGLMGSGFVVPLMKHFPQIKKQYLKWFNTPKDQDFMRGCTGDLELGHVQCVWFHAKRHEDGAFRMMEYYPTCREHETILVCNMVGQHGVVGPDNPTPIDYNALQRCLYRVDEQCCSPYRRIIGPLLGSGLAGGHWPTIANIINAALRPRQVTIFHLNNIPE